MSTCTGINIDVYLTNVDEVIKDWLIANLEDDTYTADNSYPKELDDCSRYHSLYNAKHFTLSIKNDKIRLQLIHETKNKDEDAEKFINFLIKFISKEDEDKSLIIITYDSNMTEHYVDIDKTRINNSRDEVITIYLTDELLDFDNEDYSGLTIPYRERVRKYISNKR